MLTARRPSRSKSKRPDPAVVGEPSPLKLQLDAIAERLRDALSTAQHPRMEESSVAKQLAMLTPMLQTLEESFSDLSEAVWVEDISERNGLPLAEARAIAQSEQDFRRAERLEETSIRPSLGRHRAAAGDLVHGMNVRFTAGGKAALEKLAAHEQRSQQQIFTLIAEPVLIEAAKKLP